MLKRQWDLFYVSKNESIDSLISRYSTLVCDLKENQVEYDKLDINEKFHDALPPAWE